MGVMKWNANTYVSRICQHPFVSANLCPHSAQSVGRNILYNFKMPKTSFSGNIRFGASVLHCRTHIVLRKRDAHIWLPKLHNSVAEPEL
jgi:hypothetical protein